MRKKIIKRRWWKKIQNEDKYNNNQNDMEKMVDAGKITKRKLGFKKRNNYCAIKKEH